MTENHNINQMTYPPEREGNDEDGGLSGARELMSRTRWKHEAMQIPLDDTNLTDQERAVIIKCINDETLNQEDMDQLQMVLSRYRPAIQKYQPARAVENFQENVQYVEDEKAFLKLLDQEAQNQKITMYYPLNSGGEARLDLVVKPITDAQAVLNVSENLDIFADHTPDEVKAYTDYTQGKAQTPEEYAIARKIEQEIQTQNNLNNTMESIIEFLALQTSFQGHDSSYEDMRKVYTRMHVGYLLLLFARVKELTHMDDVDVDRIFRQSD